jgi:tRNA modification GTPase
MFAHQYNPEDTIVAITTPAGKGAVGMIRISGNKAFSLTELLTKKEIHAWPSHTIHLSRFYEKEEIIDEGLVLKFNGPNSYTGEDTIELNCHGSPLILQKTLQTLISLGARMAAPGEFTFRAFINGKLDLAQAEAVADVINAESEKGLTNALKHLKGGFSKSIQTLRTDLIKFASLIELELDFGEEDVEFAERDALLKKIEELRIEITQLIESFKVGNAISKGIPTAIVGKPNAGKSSLLNTILNDDRAIVSNIAGTTRDTIEELFNINGLLYRLIDTAGIRETEDVIEKIGVKKALEKISEADIVLYLIDAQTFNITELRDLVNAQYHQNSKLIVCLNKIDLLTEIELLELQTSIKNEKLQEHNIETLFLSTTKKQGIAELKELMSKDILNQLRANEQLLTNNRHYEALSKANEQLLLCKNAIEQRISNDLLAEDLKLALYHLGEVSGTISNDDLLESIFRDFCIGK